MMKLKLLVLAGMVLMSAMAALPGNVREKERYPGIFPGRLVEIVAKEANLTGEQIRAIKELNSAAEKEIVKLQAGVNLYESTLFGVLDEPRPDPGAVMDLIDKIGVLKTRMEQARMRNFLQINEILTSEQKKKVRALLEPAEAGASAP